MNTWRNIKTDRPPVGEPVLVTDGIYVYFGSFAGDPEDLIFESGDIQAGEPYFCSDISVLTGWQPGPATMQAAEEPERETGHWINESNEGDLAVCSCCGECYDTTEGTFDLFCAFYHYCPNCGAKMEREENNG